MLTSQKVRNVEGEKNKMKLGDLKPEPDFPNTEMKKSEDLDGTKMTVTDVCLKQGKDNQYYTIKATNNENVEISFACGGLAIMQKIGLLLEKQDLKAEVDKPVKLKESAEGVFVERKSDKGRMYYDFE